MSFLKQHRVYFAAACLSALFNIFSWQFPFFWDTLLTSSVTHYYLAHGFGNLILPASLDAGHPPVFYFYITVLFKLFGPSLMVAHLAMLPFLLIGVFSFIRLLRQLEFVEREQWTGMLLFFAIPAVAAQYSLVSYDAVLLSLYLASLTFFLDHRRWAFSLALLLIAGITGRGIFAIAAIFLTCFLFHRSMIRKWWITYVPAILFFIGWYWLHYYQTGYIFSPDNGWSGHRGLAEGPQIFSNLAAIARTLFDLGIVFLFAANVFVFVVMRKLPVRYRIWMIPFLVFSVSFLFLSNPVNHRYYLVVYVLLLLPVLKWLSGKRLVYAFLLMFLLLAGHFQVYPRKISNGWDCTLAHLPYHRLKQEFLQFADSAQLDRSRVGTVFPMNTSRKQDYLSGDSIRMLNVNGQMMDSVTYVLYSNVGNDFSDEQLEELNRWETVRVKRTGLVEMILYENPRFSK